MNRLILSLLLAVTLMVAGAANPDSDGFYTYRLTKQQFTDGTVRDADFDSRMTFKFDGDYIYERLPGITNRTGIGVLCHKLHHKDTNGNLVYYRMLFEVMDGRYHIDNDPDCPRLIVKPDRSVINDTNPHPAWNGTIRTSVYRPCEETVHQRREDTLLE